MRRRDNGSAKSDWLLGLPRTQPEKLDAARRLDGASVGERDFEIYDYERTADPTFQLVETAQRRQGGQFIRRLKRLSTRRRYES